MVSPMNHLIACLGPSYGFLLRILLHRVEVFLGDVKGIVSARRAHPTFMKSS